MWSIKNVREKLVTHGVMQDKCAHPKEPTGICAG